jgi:hypothetical protein
VTCTNTIGTERVTCNKGPDRMLALADEVVYTRTQEHLETVERIQPEAADRK